ncbi:MAG: Fe2+-dependent dioxygenase [Alphaproteobacteria bacterium]|nr:Fe2+-dependent dioxygenase [Alphaproteobacteria bacterium]
MILCIADMLPAELLQEAQSIFARSQFADGKDTAGWHARQIKHNLQIIANQPQAQALQQKILSQIAAHSIIASAVLPKQFRPLLFSRYETGMSYDSHVDDAIMGRDANGAGAVRSDISFTLFLSPPDSYEGGELVIESTSGEQVFKLEAGQAVIYPSTSLHRVCEVTRGIRDAAVGWAQSYVRDAGQREMLFELDTVRRAIFRRDGKSPEFDRLSKVYSNLLRNWSEV